MEHKEINGCLEKFRSVNNRTLVVVDYANVANWEASLGWKIGIKELSRLVKILSSGNKLLRRFYFGSDFGRDEKVPIMTTFCSTIMNKAKINNFHIVTKNVKYIFNNNYKKGFIKKCNLDIEMAMDMLIERKKYDQLILFSGDGDMIHALKYLKDNYSKTIYVFCARGHIGREMIDGLKQGIISKIFYAEDFNYRLEKRD